ncbi:MAG: serine hydrolase, partial [Flavonifractor plautii]
MVIPEYDMAAAVLSSGGVSTYNEMAASQMLIAALAEQGVAVDQTPHTLPTAERAEMPAELMDYAGLYGDSTSAVMLTVTADGVLSTGNAPLYYYSDGSFRDENQMVMLKFVEEDNGQTYLWQKAYSSIPGLGEQPSSSYIYMKLPDNPVSPEAQSAWDARSGKLYLALNMKYSNIQYPLALPVAAVATDPANMPGYMVFDRIVDADCAE